MTDKIAITIGEKALSYWLRIMLAQKVEKIQDVEVSCELQGFQLVVRAVSYTHLTLPTIYSV